MKVYRSECGNYLCRAIDGAGTFEAWTRTGTIHWRNDNRVRTWKDAGKALHPMVYCVGGYSATQTGQKKDSFTLQLLHCDVAKVIRPYSGNTIIEQIDVVFRRQVPKTQIPHWIQSGGGLCDVTGASAADFPARTKPPTVPTAASA